MKLCLKPCHVIETAGRSATEVTIAALQANQAQPREAKDAIDSEPPWHLIWSEARAESQLEMS